MGYYYFMAKYVRNSGAIKHWYQALFILGVITISVLMLATDGRPQRLFDNRDLNDVRSAIIARTKGDVAEVKRKLQQDYGLVFKDIGYDDVYCYNSKEILNKDKLDACHTAIDPSDPQDYVSVPADEAFIVNWKQTAPAFESWLLENGWKKTWDANQSIAEILDAEPNKDRAVGVNYEKELNQTLCRFSFWRQQSAPHSLNVANGCEASL